MCLANTFHSALSKRKAGISSTKTISFNEKNYLSYPPMRVM